MPTTPPSPQGKKPSHPQGYDSKYRGAVGGGGLKSQSWCGLLPESLSTSFQLIRQPWGQPSRQQYHCRVGVASLLQAFTKEIYRLFKKYRFSLSYYEL